MALSNKRDKGLRLSELGALTGVPVATIKYYLREGLLSPGRRISATRAEYGPSHVRRLRLVRALVQVGKVPVHTVREVLAAVDDDSLSHTFRLGAALWALHTPPEGAEAKEKEGDGARDVAQGPDADEAAAEREVAELVERLGWEHTRQIGALSPLHRRLVTELATLRRLDYTYTMDELLVYARQMAAVAEVDLDLLEKIPADVEQAEAVVAAAVLFEPVLMELHRMAQEEAAVRRYGY